MSDYIWIQSLLDFEYSIENIIIPKKQYSRIDVEYGKSNIKKLTKQEFDLLSNNKIFKSFVDNKKIIIFDRVPESMLSINDKYELSLNEYEKLKNELIKLKEENSNLKKEIKNLEKELSKKNKEDKK